MTRVDGHRLRSTVRVKLTAEQAEALQRFLPEQEGMECRLRYLLVLMAEIAQSEPRYRVVPWYPVQGGPFKSYTVRLPEELFAFIRAYGAEGELDDTKQATKLVACGLELLEQLSGTEPLRKEELKRRFVEFLNRRWAEKSAI